MTTSLLHLVLWRDLDLATNLDMEHLWKRFWPMPASASFNARPELSETVLWARSDYRGSCWTFVARISMDLEAWQEACSQVHLYSQQMGGRCSKFWMHFLALSTFWGPQAELRREKWWLTVGVWIVLELALFSCQVLQTLPEYHRWPVLHLGWVHQQRSWLMFSHWMQQVRWTTPYLTSLRISGGDGDVANPVVLPTILASLAGGRCLNWTSVASW